MQTRAPLLIITWFHWNNLKSKKSVSMYKESNISSLKKFCHHSPKIWHFFHIKKIKNPNISNVSLRSYYKFRKYTHTRRHVVASPSSWISPSMIFSYCNFFFLIYPQCTLIVMDLAMSNGAFFTLNTDTQREKIGQQHQGKRKKKSP